MIQINIFFSFIDKFSVRTICYPSKVGGGPELRPCRLQRPEPIVKERPHYKSLHLNIGLALDVERPNCVFWMEEENWLSGGWRVDGGM